MLAALAVRRHDRFGSGGFDLGVFDQTIRGYSRGEVLPNTVKGMPDLLGDHFHPILVALAPLYWLWDDVRVLLVAQAALLAGAALPVFLWARRRLGTAPALLVQIATVTFFGTLAAALFDFHEVAVAAPAVSVAIYALLARRDLLLWATLAVGCLAREDVALTFAALGLCAVALGRRRLGVAVATVSCAWFTLVVLVVMPAIAGRPYAYWSYDRLGSAPADGVAGLATHPWLAVTLLVDDWTKVATIVAGLAAWAFLPVLSPMALVALPTLAERFWSSREACWGAGYHYGALLAPVLAFATVEAIARVGPQRGVRLGALVLAGSLATTVAVDPLAAGSSTLGAAQARAVAACLGTVSAGASVAASDRLVPHLTHRRRIVRLFRRDGEAVVAIDTSGAPGRVALRRVLRGPYALGCHTADVAVLRRIPGLGSTP